MSSSPTWRLAPGQRLAHRCHDGECVLFNDLTGDTHLLDQPAFDLLEVLRAAPQTALALLALDGGDAASDPALLDDLTALLDDLAALELIEALPC